MSSFKTLLKTIVYIINSFIWLLFILIPFNIMSIETFLKTALYLSAACLIAAIGLDE